LTNTDTPDPLLNEIRVDCCRLFTIWISLLAKTIAFGSRNIIIVNNKNLLFMNRDVVYSVSLVSGLSNGLLEEQFLLDVLEFLFWDGD
jgi:hypothetical protein